MATQNTRIRQRMGAEIARLRAQLGMRTQGDLATATGLGLRTIVSAERGDKVSARTMRQIENALHLPTGATDDFLHGSIDSLEANAPVPDPKPNVDVHAVAAMLFAIYDHQGGAALVDERVRLANRFNQTTMDAIQDAFYDLTQRQTETG